MINFKIQSAQGGKCHKLELSDQLNTATMRRQLQNDPLLITMVELNSLVTHQHKQYRSDLMAIKSNFTASLTPPIIMKINGVCNFVQNKFLVELSKASKYEHFQIGASNKTAVKSR